ncbi:MAG: hypothetical protein ACJ8HQ_06420 [Chthoniobacterales bacterium]
MKINLAPLRDEVWLVTIDGPPKTEHRVRVTPADRQRLGYAPNETSQLLEASFRFLLEREPNTSILRDFDLPVISRYFAEYENEIRKRGS